MENEFERQLNPLNLDAKTKQQIMNITNTAGKEYPCVSCPSKDECNSFKWFIKWFGEENAFS